MEINDKKFVVFPSIANSHTVLALCNLIKILHIEINEFHASSKDK
jgi:hypothetical protein